MSNSVDPDERAHCDFSPKFQVLFSLNNNSNKMSSATIFPRAFRVK